jgi:hypothetical protein
MSRQKFLRFATLSLILIGASSARAALSPVAIAIVAPVPPIEFPTEDVTITGVRVSALWGSHRSIYGIDLGVIGNITKQDFAGIGVSGIFNYTDGQTTIVGLQAAGITNMNVKEARIFGVQVAGVVNSNTAGSLIIGLQLAAIANLSPHATIGGAQIGLYNTAREVYGFQIGVVNVAEVLHGIQIGVLNIHKQGLFSVCPIINIGF